jgi:hypothetical protein
MVRGGCLSFVQSSEQWFFVWEEHQLLPRYLLYNSWLFYSISSPLKLRVLLFYHNCNIDGVQRIVVAVMCVFGYAYLHLEPRLRMRGAILPLPLTPIWQGA